MTPGQTLRRFREGRYTQEQLAAAIGVTTSAVTQWEIGRIVPRRARVEQLDELLGGQGELLAAFGYALPVSQRDEIADLTERMAALEAKVDQLLSALQPDTAAVAPVTPLRRAAAGATGPRTEPGRLVSRPQPAAADGDHLED